MGGLVWGAWYGENVPNLYYLLIRESDVLSVPIIATRSSTLSQKSRIIVFKKQRERNDVVLANRIQWENKLDSWIFFRLPLKIATMCF